MPIISRCGVGIVAKIPIVMKPSANEVYVFRVEATRCR
jgi:hypothetical protein